MKISQKSIEHLNDMLALMVIVDYVNGESPEEVPLETAIAYAANVFEIEIEDLSLQTLKMLNMKINAKGQTSGAIQVEFIKDTIFQTEKIGIISIQKQYLKYNYEGYTRTGTETMVLLINNREFDNAAYCEKRASEIIDKVSTMVDEDPNKKIRVYDKVHALSDIFKSMRNNDSNKAYTKVNAVANEVYDKKGYRLNNPDNVQLVDIMHFIVDKYLEYLWKKYDDETPEQYILSFVSFMDKNKKFWIEDADNESEYLQLYVKGHDTIRDIFNSVEENQVAYIIFKGLNQNILCEKEVEYSRTSNEIAQSMLNGLSKIIGRN